MQALNRFCMLTALLAGLHLGGFQGSAMAQQDAGSYRVDVRLVQVDVQVINKKTQQVASSLKQDDLQVYEDGVQQQISSFSQNELPLSVVFLIDLTDTVRPVLQTLAEGAQKALAHLKPQDEVAVLVYSASTYRVQDFTTDRALTAAAIDKAAHLGSREAAFFNEAIFQTATYLSGSKNPDSRRVILWFTDNVPTIPTDDLRMSHGQSLAGKELHTEKQAMEQLFRTGAVVCTLLKRSELSELDDAGRHSVNVPDRMMHPPGDVFEYAKATGGMVVESSNKMVPAKLAQLLDDLHMRYTLGYHPSAQKAKGQFCAIKVELAPEIKKSQKDLVVEAKQGYYR